MVIEREEEYEIIPTSPLRRMEKRLERVETGSSSASVRRLIDQVIELIKSNQRIIDDIVKSNFELRNEMSRLPGKIDELLSTLKDFVELLKVSATEEAVGEVSRDVMQPMTSAMTQLVDQGKKNMELQGAILASLETMDKRLKRLYTTQATTGAYRR